MNLKMGNGKKVNLKFDGNGDVFGPFSGAQTIDTPPRPYSSFLCSENDSNNPQQMNNA